MGMVIFYLFFCCGASSPLAQRCGVEKRVSLPSKKVFSKKMWRKIWSEGVKFICKFLIEKTTTTPKRDTVVTLSFIFPLDCTTQGFD